MPGGQCYFQVVFSNWRLGWTHPYSWLRERFAVWPFQQQSPSGRGCSAACTLVLLLSSLSRCCHSHTHPTPKEEPAFCSTGGRSWLAGVPFCGLDNNDNHVALSFSEDPGQVAVNAELQNEEKVFFLVCSPWLWSTRFPGCGSCCVEAGYPELLIGWGVHSGWCCRGGVNDNTQYVAGTCSQSPSVQEIIEGILQLGSLNCEGAIDGNCV